MNITVYLPFILSLCSIIITLLATWLTKALNNHLNIANDAHTQAVISTAVSRGAGIALEIITTGLSSYSMSALKGRAVAAGVSHITDTIPDALNRWNIPEPEITSHLTTLVTGELAKIPAYQALLLPSEPLPVAVATDICLSSPKISDEPQPVVATPIRSGV